MGGFCLMGGRARSACVVFLCIFAGSIVRVFLLIDSFVLSNTSYYAGCVRESGPTLGAISSGATEGD